MPKYRLGIDLGSNSIGWCALKLDSDGKPCGVLDAGVRILTPNEEAGRDPQSKASLAANRRVARSMRRRRDRFVRRQKKLMETLIASGLMPAVEAERKQLEKLDPYWLRAAALDQKLTLHELGRAVFHLNQRRGFKSNRIADGGDEEASATKAGMVALREALEASGARTLGELLARRHKRDRNGHLIQEGAGVASPEPVRFRPTSQGARNLYDFYPSRQMTEDELDQIWMVQGQYHPELSGKLLARLKRIIIEQRPLRRPIVGRCTLRPEKDVRTVGGFEIDFGERAPKAHPLFQRFRILQDVSQLRIAVPGKPQRYLTMQERDAIAAHLMSKTGNIIEFEKLRKSSRLPDEARFNYELSGRSGFPPDQTAAKLGAAKALGKLWRSWPRDSQVEVVERLLLTEDAGQLIDWFCDQFGIEEQNAKVVSELRMPQGHGQFGRSVLADLVEVMETETRDVTDPVTGEIFSRPITYDEAVAELGLHHSALAVSDGYSELPYYGQAMSRNVISNPHAPKGSQEHIGRVPNPTVHIGLNQMRKVVNTLIDVYGKPSEIVIELARELKLNEQRKKEIESQNKENQKKNDARRQALEKLGLPATHGNMLLLRLYDELPADERVCVYSGTPISMTMLMDGSIDIDHVLPYSKTLDDGIGNKVLCTREANRRKGNRSPSEAWSTDALSEIVDRAERIYPHKAWRFQPDAMERVEAEGGFIARQLTDTQHLSRMTKSYLGLLYGEEANSRVWAIPGRLTAMLRGKWGLNELLPDHNYANVNQPKNRKDHRHHAIDAFVTGCTDRGLLNRIARASGRGEELDIDRLFAKGEFPEPFDGYRSALSTRLGKIIVSHKPDHGIPAATKSNVHVTSGKLHQETAFGLVDEEIGGKAFNLVTRKPITSLTKGEIDRVRDSQLRELLQVVLYEAELHKEKLEEALARFGQERNIRRVRVLKTEQSVRKVVHGDGFTKAYSPGSNHCIEIFKLENGDWAGEGITIYDANQPEFEPNWRMNFPNAQFIMRVHNGDLVEGDFGDGRVVARVYRLEPSAKRVRLVPHNEAGSIDQRHKDPDDPLNWIFASYAKLQGAAARLVRADPIGRLTYLDQ